MIEGLPTEPSEFQSRVLSYRRHCNILNAGARGTGKSVSLVLDIIDHVNELKNAASVLLLRESWNGILEISEKLYATSRAAFGPSVTMNKGSGVIAYPNGGHVYFRNIGDSDSFAAMQGKTYTMIAGDEAGGYPPAAIQYLQLLRSNLRPPRGIRSHIHLTANPMGRAHTHFLRHHVNKAPPWVPYQIDGIWWVNCHSEIGCNPYIDNEAYLREITAATAGNPALRAAWTTGSWMEKGGGLMFDIFEPRIHVRPPPHTTRMKFVVGSDWGTASPSVAILAGELLDPMQNYIPGDIFLIDEVDTCREPGNYADGDGTSAGTWAAMIKDLLERNGVSTQTEVIIDNARGLNKDETVVNILREEGLNASPPRHKDRIGGWTSLRQKLASAEHGDGKGLWISPRCPGLIATMETAIRDDLRPADLHRHLKEDHHLDAGRYAVAALGEGAKSSQSKVIGAW